MPIGTHLHPYIAWQYRGATMLSNVEGQISYTRFLPSALSYWVGRLQINKRSYYIYNV